MTESDFVAFIQHEIPQQTADPNGEPIVYEARCLYNELEDALCRNYATNTCAVAGCIGLLLFCPLYRRRSRQVAETWQLYVTDRSFVHTIVQRALFGCEYPSTIRIPLAHIKAVSVNEPLAECGPATCLCSTGPDAVVVTLKREYRWQYSACCGGRLAFRYAENADEFADAVRHQMSTGSY